MKPIQLAKWISLALTTQVAFQSDAWPQTISLSPSAEGPIGHLRFGSLPAWDVQPFTFQTPGTFLSQYNTIQLRLDAPAGFAWHVPSGLSGLPRTLRFDMFYGSTLPLASVPITSTSLDFNFVSGRPEDLTTTRESALVFATGDGFSFRWSGSVDHDIVFTGFTVTFGYDNSLLPEAPLRDFVACNLMVSFMGANRELALTPVPEPTAFALGACGLLALLCRGKRESIRSKLHN